MTLARPDLAPLVCDSVPDPLDDHLELTIRFARSANPDAPQGTLVLQRGDETVPFAGWLDLMAIVEQALQTKRDEPA